MTPEVTPEVIEMIDEATLCYLRRDMPGMLTKLRDATRSQGGKKIAVDKTYIKLITQQRVVDYLYSDEGRAIVRDRSTP
jgi:hypothetical protein